MRASRELLAVGVAAILLTACGGDDPPVAEPQVSAQPEQRLTIVSPVDGATVAGPVTLRVTAPDGIEIGAPDTGNMHLHVYVDGGDEIVCNTPIRAFDLAPGAHALRVVLAQPNHDETDLSETVRVTVGDAS